ncbi:hypothetical protein [Polaromonas naphthalenivorans]|uniref:Uncharacterized protein n=1 Tax=Polaromonas naphthalenivorans (strain CJ2) TaxID=365044 RepID=A1VSJ5_POLNA|nr:hypothetical protein [Polaromonas naphthalenivorans]ABM38623.1 hypothetical protein Pnap_3326 [Polaromonas naphthalenivorans CJ2]
MNGLKKPRRPRWPANRLAHESTVHKVTPFATEETAALSNEAHLAWHHLINGTGTKAHFDTLATSLNASLILSEPIGQAAIDVAVRAQQAMVSMQARFHRVGRFGADAQALADVPPGLDLYDQLLSFANPLQLVQAVCKSWKRIAAGDVLAPAYPAAAAVTAGAGA